MNLYTFFPLNAQRASAITGPIGAVANFAGAIAGAITKWHKRNKAIRELSALSDHLLKDIGISRGEIRAVVDAMLTAPEPRRAARPGLVSRLVMGRLGRDASFFEYVEAPIAHRLLQRVQHALVELEPADNPYLQWILTGRHTTALPLALREENFETIRNNLDRLEWQCRSAEDYLAGAATGTIDRFNMSDIFEYMSSENYHALLEQLIEAGKAGGRIAYWNTFVDRRRPSHMQDRLHSLDELAQRLHLSDKAFFYDRFVVEEIV